MRIALGLIALVAAFFIAGRYIDAPLREASPAELQEPADDTPGPPPAPAPPTLEVPPPGTGEPKPLEPPPGAPPRVPETTLPGPHQQTAAPTTVVTGPITAPPPASTGEAPRATPAITIGQRAQEAGKDFAEAYQLLIAGQKKEK